MNTSINFKKKILLLQKMQQEEKYYLKNKKFNFLPLLWFESHQKRTLLQNKFH